MPVSYIFVNSYYFIRLVILPGSSMPGCEAAAQASGGSLLPAHGGYAGEV